MPASVHISLNVSDFDGSVDFYRRFLGEPIKLETNYAKFVGNDPEIHLALQPVAHLAAGGPLSHLGIRVDSTDAVRAWREALGARGLAVDIEKRESCCYAVQDKFWVSDPDGNRWEVYTVLEDIAQAHEAGTTCCLPAADGQTSCCAS